MPDIDDMSDADIVEWAIERLKEAQENKRVAEATYYLSVINRKSVTVSKEVIAKKETNETVEHDQ